VLRSMPRATAYKDGPRADEANSPESSGRAIAMSDLTQHPTNFGETNRQSVDRPSLGQLLWCPTDQLQPHPTSLRHQFTPSADEISHLVGKDDSACEEPLPVTQGFLIVTCHAQWRVARRLKRGMVPCLQRTMTEEESVLAPLESNQSRNGLNVYCRILIALDLELRSPNALGQTRESGASLRVRQISRKLTASTCSRTSWKN